ncbi:hypothetical protein [Photobacterium phosphoreum]|uniref:hypothetical protein n=1 Tax=Photobacterium phosphoreum TaxID=659 RepID=UPI0005D358AE|nr:hypothetical protein [Photobacterium phosphoreum]KJF84532.1 hypothetical protein UB41_19815 [Photobacterium phosphoreum]PQJ90304.1 hypothetical protein BTO21_00685 [Photobacterium phosphoreum]PSV71992.1 hypothetical protein CTM77_06370 [Photobacterium phosphoreum]
MTEVEIIELINSQVSAKKLAQVALPTMQSMEYEDFIAILYDKVALQLEALENDADHFLESSEDCITSALVRQLNVNEYLEAESQVKRKGGAVDLVVKGYGHEWIAEAKRLTSNDKAFEGILQLLTRYAKRDKQAGLLVYVQTGQYRKKIDAWLEFLSLSGKWNRYVENIVQEEFKDGVKNFMNTHELIDRSEHIADTKVTLDRGSDIFVRHFFCNLVYQPSDKSGSQAIKIREASAKLKLRDIYDRSIASTPEEIDTKEVKQVLSLMFRDTKAK